MDRHQRGSWLDVTELNPGWDGCSRSVSVAGYSEGAAVCRGLDGGSRLAAGGNPEGHCPGEKIRFKFAILAGQKKNPTTKQQPISDLGIKICTKCENTGVNWILGTLLNPVTCTRALFPALFSLVRDASIPFNIPAHAPWLTDRPGESRFRSESTGSRVFPDAPLTFSSLR